MKYLQEGASRIIRQAIYHIKMLSNYIRKKYFNKTKSKEKKSKKKRKN